MARTAKRPWGLFPIRAQDTDSSLDARTTTMSTTITEQFWSLFQQGHYENKVTSKDPDVLYDGRASDAFEKGCSKGKNHLCVSGQFLKDGKGTAITSNFYLPLQRILKNAQKIRTESRPTDCGIRKTFVP